MYPELSGASFQRAHMTTADITKALKERAGKAHDQYIEATTEVLCAAIEDVTGAYPSDQLREKLYAAIRFDI